MKKIYTIPNVLTTINMICGYYSVIASMHDQFLTAAWAIVAAAVFDMLDGRIARLAKATSSFGVEYDSLCDLISFGMAPSILVYSWALKPYDRLGWLTAFMFLVCGALRLARFNVNLEEISKKYFQGLPSPIAAGTIATFIIFSDALSLFRTMNPGFVALVLTLFLALLMISVIRFPSFKELNWRSRASFSYLLMGVVAMILIAMRPEVAFFIVLSSYIVLSLVWRGTIRLKNFNVKSSTFQSNI